MLRVGHGGAAALVRANTLASFDAALELGVDMVEFDVRTHAGRLVLAHAPWDRRQGLSLDEALAHLSLGRFADVRLNVDLKDCGGEAALLYALERHGVTDRCIVSSRLAPALDRIRRLDPSVRTGISVGGPFTRRDWSRRCLDALARRRFDAVMAHHRLVDARFVDAVRERAGEVYAWTVDERRLIDRLRDAGVSGVVTNDPRLFAPLTAG